MAKGFVACACWTRGADGRVPRLDQKDQTRDNANSVRTWNG
jgi:hypothetical protein